VNARDSLAADRDAERAWEHARDNAEFGIVGESQSALALTAIAAELRAARVYANYLEGREGSRTRDKVEQLRTGTGLS